MAGLIDSENLLRQNLEHRVNDTNAVLEGECVAQASSLATTIATALKAGNKIIFFGNGGSSMDAGHLAAEFLGRFRYDRPSLPSVSLSDSTAAMTAIGNDYSYDEVFARQLRGLAGPGDVAVGLSTSGNSANVVNALRAAKEFGAYAAALTGASGGKAADVADLCIKVPTDDTPRVQEICMHLGHSICEIVEQELFPQE